jgi:hypothetical protein
MGIMERGSRRPQRRGKRPGVTDAERGLRRRAIRRKNVNLDQRLINRAREALGATTETEAISRALAMAADLAEFRKEIAAGGRALYGKGGFSHVDDPSVLEFGGFLRPQTRQAS